MPSPAISKALARVSGTTMPHGRLRCATTSSGSPVHPNSTVAGRHDCGNLPDNVEIELRLSGWRLPSPPCGRTEVNHKEDRPPMAPMAKHDRRSSRREPSTSCFGLDPGAAARCSPSSGASGALFTGSASQPRYRPSRQSRKPTGARRRDVAEREEPRAAGRPAGRAATTWRAQR